MEVMRIRPICPRALTGFFLVFIYTALPVFADDWPMWRYDANRSAASDQKLDGIRQLLFKLIEKNDLFLSTPEPELVLNRINDYNIELIFRVWIENEKDHIPVRFKLREQILECLLEEGIDMPFETFEINIKDK